MYPTQVQPGGWCPRCLETSHWEDTCWVSATEVTCTTCNLPGHLPCIHQVTHKYMEIMLHLRVTFVTSNQTDFTVFKLNFPLSGH